MATYKNYALMATAMMFASATFGEYAKPLEIVDPAATSLTDAQKASLNDNEYDALVFNNGGIVEVTGIGSFGGDIVIKSGSVMKGSGQACVGTAAGKTIVENGGSFFYYRTAYSDLPANPNSEHYEIAGAGAKGYGALHFEYNAQAQSDQGAAVFAEVTLTEPATIASKNSNTSGRFTVVGKFHQNSQKLTLSCGEPSFSPSVWDDPADVETTCGYFHASDKWNTVYKEGYRLIWNGGNWSVYGARYLAWPVIVKKSGSLSIGSGKPTSPAALINNYKGRFTIESGVTLTISDWSSGAGRVYFSGGIDGEGKLTSGCNNADMCHVGDVSGSVTVANTGSGTLVVYGKITDSASVSASAGTVSVEGNGNDYAGLTKVTGGKISFADEGSFPSAGLTAENITSRISTSGSGKIDFVAKCAGDEKGFTVDGFKKIADLTSAAEIKNLQLVVPEGKSFDYAQDIAGSGYNTYFAAGGALTLSGLFSDGFVPSLSNVSGKLILTQGYGADAESPDGLGTLSKGELELGGDFQMTVAAGHANNLIIGSANAGAIVRVKGNAKYVAEKNSNAHASQPKPIRIGNGENSRAILEVGDNAYFSGKLLIANDSVGMVGSVYQRGGTVNTPNSSADMGWGNSGWSTPSQSFYEICGGTYQVGYWTRQAIAPNAIGMFYQHGGTVKLNSRFIPCIRGTGVVYQTSGTWTNGDQNDIGYGEWSSWAPGGFCNWTITGEGTKYTSSNLIRVGAHDGAIHIFNVNNGARLETMQVSAGKTNLNSRGILNFNGGAYAPSGASCLGNETNTGNGGQPEIYIYGGGMTFDTSRVTASDKVTTVNASFLAPTGKGVKSIAMPPSELPEGYIAPPLVVIEGDGFGATAVAEFDSTNKVVTGITVTSPGCDYTTARAYFYGGGPKASNGYVECGAVALEDNVSGGLTKIGAGNLKLVNCEHTYTGVTYVAQGTLSTYGRNENKERILANTAVRIAKGAVLDLYWHASYVKAFGGAGICYNQGPTRTGELFYTKDEVADGGLTFSNTDVATAGATGRLELIANTVVKISDLDELDHSKTYPLVTCTASLTIDGGLTLEGGDAGRWRLVTDSKKLSLRPIGGMVILLK